MTGLALQADDLAGFAAALARAAALVATAPVTGDRTTPRIVQALLATLLAATGLCLHGPIALDGPDGLVPVIAAEVAFGLVAGLSARLLLGGVDLGGQVLGLQLGIGTAGQLDPATGDESLPTRRLIVALGGLAFLGLGGLGAMARVIAAPPPPPLGLWAAALAIPDHAAEALTLGARIAAPLVLAGTGATIAMAFASRSAPNVNVFSVELALRALVAGAALVACAPALIGDVTLAAHRAVDLLRGFAP